MSTQPERSLDSLVAEALREDYLDLLLLAGRLARHNAEQLPPGNRREADEVRKLILKTVAQARDRIGLRRFTGAPEAVVEAEIAIIAFLDWVAVKRYALENWRSLRENYYRDYEDAGRDGASISDLGKYLYERLEELRRSPDKLQRVSIELLAVYSCCLRLGYLASYDERPNELADLRQKLDEALRLRRASGQKSAFSPPSSQESDLRLTPDLPLLEQGGPPPLVLNPLWITGLALVLLIIMGIGLRIALFQKERTTLQALARSRDEIQKLASDTEDICRGTPTRSGPVVAEGLSKAPLQPRRAASLRRRLR